MQEIPPSIYGLIDSGSWDVDQVEDQNPDQKKGRSVRRDKELKVTDEREYYDNE